MDQKKLYAIDLFSGCGGVTAGLKKAGIEVRAAVEINDIAIKTYSENNKNIPVIHDDIRNVSGDCLKNIAGILEQDIFLLVACPPCQGFSSIRRGGDKDKRNQLVFQYIRLVKELKPEFILMENVAGMSRGKGKKTFEKAYKEFEKEYKCIYDILNAADYGVPQTRRRLVLHGIRKDVYEKWKSSLKLELPKQTHVAPAKKKKDDGLKEWITSSVILGLPSLKAGEVCKVEGVFNHASNSMVDTNVQRIRYIREHGGSRTCLPENLVLSCHKDKTGHTDVYGIMDMTKPAPTITGGCMHYSKGRFGHPIDDRALSAREAARLQSFDDHYIFHGNNSQMALQIGNAVPVDLAKASGIYFSDLFQLIKSEPKEE
ncbi:MAG: DNA cytosine methyltransferase [Lachnospiraceae bacterium]|nr:DNA cytosine methyltransferase [Lachnospiraceae bacterium]